MKQTGMKITRHEAIFIPVYSIISLLSHAVSLCPRLILGDKIDKLQTFAYQEIGNNSSDHHTDAETKDCPESTVPFTVGLQQLVAALGEVVAQFLATFS